MGEEGNGERQETVAGLPPEGGQRFLNALGAFSAAETDHFAGTVQDARIEQRERPPSVFKREGSGGPTVLVVAKNTGPLNYLLPVLNKLHERGATVYLRVTGVAQDKAHKPDDEAAQFLDGFTMCDPTELDTVEFDVIVRSVGDAENGGSALPAEDETRHWRAAVVNIEDYPGNGDKPDRGSPVSADVVLSSDPVSKKRSHQRRERSDGQVVVTGNPAFDKYAEKDPVVERKAARERMGFAELGITDDTFVVTFSGQLAPAAQTGLETFARHLQNYRAANPERKLAFVYSFHLRALTQPEQQPFVKRAYEIFDELRAVGIQVVVIDQKVGDPTRPDPDTVGYASDLLVSTHSTEGLASVHRGVATMHVDFPQEGHEAHWDEAHPNGEDQPIVTSGSTFHIKDGASDEEAGAELARAIDDQDARDEKIKTGKDNFQSDGKAGDRVADAIIGAVVHRVPKDVGKLGKST